MFRRDVNVDQEVYDQIYRKLYQEATPGMDYDNAEPEEHGVPWFKLHYLDGERIKEIIEEVCSDYNIGNKDRKTISTTILLGAAPSSNLEKVKEKRNELGLEDISDKEGDIK